MKGEGSRTQGDVKDIEAVLIALCAVVRIGLEREAGRGGMSELDAMMMRSF